MKASVMRSLCLRCNLALFHNSKPTYFDVAHNSTSLLDFWLVSEMSLISYSDQVQCPGISHHALIFSTFFEYRNFKNIDWEGLFSFLSSVNTDSFFSTSCIDSQWSHLSSLLESLYSFVPVVRKRIPNCVDNWMQSNSIVLAISLRDLAILFLDRLLLGRIGKSFVGIAIGPRVLFVRKGRNILLICFLVWIHPLCGKF